MSFSATMEGSVNRRLFATSTLHIPESPSWSATVSLYVFRDRKMFYKWSSLWIIRLIGSNQKIFLSYGYTFKFKSIQFEIFIQLTTLNEDYLLQQNSKCTGHMANLLPRTLRVVGLSGNWKNKISRDNHSYHHISQHYFLMNHVLFNY